MQSGCKCLTMINKSDACSTYKGCGSKMKRLDRPTITSPTDVESNSHFRDIWGDRRKFARHVRERVDDGRLTGLGGVGLRFEHEGWGPWGPCVENHILKRGTSHENIRVWSANRGKGKDGSRELAHRTTLHYVHLNGCQEAILTASRAEKTRLLIDCRSSAHGSSS
jgi:hypothetical protein